MPASVFYCNLETVSVENGQPWGEVGEGVENSDTETIVMVILENLNKNVNC